MDPRAANTLLTEIQYTRPYLYPKQQQAIFSGKRWSLIEASTKSGKTQGSIVRFIEWGLFGAGKFPVAPGQHYWWVAPTFGQSEIAFERIKLNLTPGSFTSKANPPTIMLPTGTHLDFKSGDNPNGLYGEDVYAAVGDEASRWVPSAWPALRSTLTATSGPAVLIGNVQGKANFFYEFCRRVEAGLEPNGAYSRLTWKDAVEAGILDIEEIEDARRNLSEREFRELYEAIASDDTGNPFGESHIRQCIQIGLASGPPVAFGIDLAKKQDYLVVIGLNDRGQVCSFDRWQDTPWRTSIQRIHKICGEDIAVLVDSTGIGDPVLEELQVEHGNFRGYNFTQASKQRLMEGLAVSIQGHEIGFPDGPIVQELLRFEYELTRTGVRYCVSEDTPVLSSDLRWISAGSLQKGDNLIGFDEEPRDGSKVRQWRLAEVTDSGRIRRPTYKITLKDGTNFICSGEHRWLISYSSLHKLSWKTTDELRPYDNLIRVCDTWSSENSYMAGYLAGVFDGEGSLQQQIRGDHAGYTTRINFSQRENEVAEQSRIALSMFDFEWAESPGGGTNKDVISFGITDRIHSVLRLLGQIRPKRLLAKFDPNKLGSMWAKDHVSIESIEYIGEHTLVAIGTSTSTFIANGFATHNSAPEGYNDDCVCALALARQAWAETQPAANIMDYWAEQAQRSRETQAQVPGVLGGWSEDSDPDSVDRLAKLLDNELTDLYETTLRAYDAPKLKCFHCHQDVGADRISDGVYVWHQQCLSGGSLRAA